MQGTHSESCNVRTGISSAVYNELHKFSGFGGQLQQRPPSSRKATSGYMWNFTVMVVSISTGSWFNREGLYFHCFTASIAACCSIGCPLIACRFSMFPLLLMVASNTTSPSMCAILAIWGYVGSTRCDNWPSATPDDTRILSGRATGGGRGADDPTLPPRTPPTEPPGTPPTTPPVTPVLAAGASASTLFWMFLRILLGVRSSPFK